MFYHVQQNIFVVIYYQIIQYIYIYIYISSWIMDQTESEIMCLQSLLISSFPQWNPFTGSQNVMLTMGRIKIRTTEGARLTLIVAEKGFRNRVQILHPNSFKENKESIYSTIEDLFYPQTRLLLGTATPGQNGSGVLSTKGWHHSFFGFIGFYRTSTIVVI